MSIRIEEVGKEFEYRAYALKEGKRVSPWHDLDLKEPGSEVDHF
jgi:hypothetical protein